MGASASSSQLPTPVQAGVMPGNMPAQMSAVNANRLALIQKLNPNAQLGNLYAQLNQQQALNTSAEAEREQPSMVMQGQGRQGGSRNRQPSPAAANYTT